MNASIAAKAAAPATVMMLLAAPVSTAVTPGESFVYNWTETSGSNVGLTGTADFILGPASTKTGFYDIASFSVTQNGGFCSLCSPLTENLSLVSFDSTTDGVVGKITGTYKNTKGKTHSFELITMDLPGGTWTFDDTGPGGSTRVSMGTYETTTRGVPEPATLALLSLGLLGLGISRRRIAR